jgi:hypothetical protein
VQPFDIAIHIGGIFDTIHIGSRVDITVNSGLLHCHNPKATCLTVGAFPPCILQNHATGCGDSGGGGQSTGVVWLPGLSCCNLVSIFAFNLAYLGIFVCFPVNSENVYTFITELQGTYRLSPTTYVPVEVFASVFGATNTLLVSWFCGCALLYSANIQGSGGEVKGTI